MFKRFLVDPSTGSSALQGNWKDIASAFRSALYAGLGIFLANILVYFQSTSSGLLVVKGTDFTIPLTFAVVFILKLIIQTINNNK